MTIFGPRIPTYLLDLMIMPIDGDTLIVALLRHREFRSSIKPINLVRPIEGTIALIVVLLFLLSVQTFFLRPQRSQLRRFDQMRQRGAHNAIDRPPVRSASVELCGDRRQSLVK